MGPVRLVVTVAALAATATTRAQWTVVDLHPNAYKSSAAVAVRGGQQVGNIVTNGSVGFAHGGVWTGTAVSWSQFVVPGTTGSQINGVDGGRQVGCVFVGGAVYAIIRDGASIINLTPAGATWAIANCIDGAFQGGEVQVGGSPQASLWNNTAESHVSLHPAGAVSSTVTGIGGGQQVGNARINGLDRACLWSGTAASWVDLTPAGAGQSYATGVYNGQQVGYCRIGGIFHAGRWSGSSASWVDMNPPLSTESGLSGVYDGEQVGYAVIGDVFRAGLWRGTAQSFVDLHAMLPPQQYVQSQALAVWHDATTTYVVGSALRAAPSGNRHAILWTGPRAPAACYPDCNSDTALNLADFGCFQTKFALGDGYADCNGDGVRNLADFGCFTTRFALGCP